MYFSYCTCIGALGRDCCYQEYRASKFFFASLDSLWGHMAVGYESDEVNQRARVFLGPGGELWAGSDVYALPFLGMVLPSGFRRWASDLWLVSG